MTNNIDSLYELIKQKSEEKGRPLEIICDWDETVQITKAAVYQKLLNKENISLIPVDIIFSIWKEGYFKEELSKEFEDIRKKPELYGLQKPFSSIAEELLKACKENLIGKLVFLSYTSKIRNPSGFNEKKFKQFQKSFGKLPNAEMKMLSFIPNTGTYFHKWPWIKENRPDFDMMIDDNPIILSEAVKNLPSDKTFVATDYASNKDLQGENIYHVKTTLSNLRNEDFIDSSPTPVTKFLTNLQVLKSKFPSKTPVVLITTGSMNPIHNQHINMFELAKKEIESRDPNKKVVVGYISPTSDYYLKKKLKDEVISANQRVDMAKLSVEENTWIEVDTWAIETSKSLSRHVSNIEVVKNLSEFLNSKIPKDFYGEIKIMYLCGDDLIIRQPARQKEKERENERTRNESSRFKKLIEGGHDIVIIGRNSNDVEWKNKCENVLDSICGPGSGWKDHVWFVTGNDNAKTSSTKIRNILKEKAEGDLSNLLHPKVLEYIKNNEIFLREKEDKDIRRERERERERAIYWIVGGGIGVLILVGLLIIFWKKKRRKLLKKK